MPGWYFSRRPERAKTFHLNYDPVDDDLLKILKDEEADAATYHDSELAQEQAEAMDRYHARPYGNEVENRSRVVTHDIEDTVNWMLPALMRTFASSDDLITCEDDNLNDDDDALTTTAQYLRHVFFKQCGGEHIIHDFTFDGLVQKVGVIRCAWEDARPLAPVVRDGVTVEQLLRYDNDPEYEILEVSPDGEVEAIEAEAEPVQQGAPEPVPGLMAPEQQAPLGLLAGAQQPAPLQPQMPAGVPLAQTYSVKLQRIPRTGKPLVENVAPENFRISRRAKSVELASYHGAQFEEFLADVVSMWPDKAHDLDPEGRYLSTPNDDVDADTDVRVLARFPDQPESMRQVDDEMREKVWLKIEYLRCDFDRDGIVELRRIVRVDDIILENDVVEESEFTVWSPIRVAHKAIGRSIADTLLDIQKIRTALTRRAMDGLSQSLTPRTFYNKRAAADDPTFVDQLLDHDVGAAIPVDGNPSEMLMVQTTPDVSASAFQAIEYWDRRSEEASGVNRHAMGIQPQAITDTKGGIDMLQSAANARIEQVARHIGTSLEVALGKLLRLIVRHQHTPQIFKVAGKRVEWDPRRVSDQMAVSVHVGMTAESREKKLSYLGAILNAQKEVLVQLGQGNPIVSLKNIRHTLGQMVQVMGYRNVTPFFAEVPEGWQPPAPGPDPKTVEVQGKQQLAQAELQSKQQMQQAELVGKRQLAEFEANQKSQERLRQIEVDRELAVLRIDAERESTREKAANEMMLARERMAQEAELAREKMDMEREAQQEALKLKAPAGDGGDGSYRSGGRLDA